MTTYTLTVSTSALGLGVIAGAHVVIEQRRAVIADTFPPVPFSTRNNQATGIDGVCVLLLNPDDLSTYHFAKIFDVLGIPVFEKSFYMPTNDANLHDSLSSVVIGGGSLIQFKNEGDNLGTPTTVFNVDVVGEGIEATIDGDTVTITVERNAIQYQKDGNNLGLSTDISTINIASGLDAIFEDGILTISSGGSKAFVAITDINPYNSSDNVGNKSKNTNDNFTLESCTSSTTDIKVKVLAVTGSVFKPTVDVNGATATLTRNALTDVWEGEARVTLTGSSPYIVTATHSDGASYDAIVNTQAAPIVNSVVFSGAYPNTSQTSHAANQTLSLVITGDTPFVDLEVMGDSTTATVAVASGATFAATTSKTISVTVADHGNTPTAYPAKVRIKNANGTWSAIAASNTTASVNGTNTILLDNTQPPFSFGTLTYPGTQTALKTGDSVTFTPSDSAVDTILYSALSVAGLAQLNITAATTKGSKSFSYAAGDYNTSTNNLRAVVGKTSNATSATFDTIVKIANADPVLTIALPAARLRSNVTYQSHAITVTADQELSSFAMSAGLIGGVAAGEFAGSWVGSTDKKTWTRTLNVIDSDPKGAASFTSLSAVNLAGKTVTTATTKYLITAPSTYSTPVGNLNYTLGGFVARTLTMSGTFGRKAAIGTTVTNTTKLRVTNFSKAGVSPTANTFYEAGTTDGLDKYTITNPDGTFNAGGNTLYNKDSANVGSNSGGTAMFEIEENV